MFGIPSHRVKLGQIYFLTISHTQYVHLYIWQDKINNMFQVKHVAYFTLSYMSCMTDLKNIYIYIYTHISNSKHNWNG